ncbi:MAG: UDP-N-acetylmuramate dehydrogenase [Patescibacteria group bacterium]
MIAIQKNVPLSSLTTFRVGGDAAYFCEVRTPVELAEASALFVKNRQTYGSFFILGEGSNTLALDGGYAGLAVRVLIKGVKWKEIVDAAACDKVEVVSGGGEHWDDLVGLTVGKGYYGLENLSGIPGTVGAAPVQNIGAYGAEVKDCISFVEAFHFETGETRMFTPEECCFGYRDSFFKSVEGRLWVITKVGFLLDKKGRVNIGYKDLKTRFTERYSSQVSLAEVRDAVLEIRKQKLPDISLLGTAGSFFKNPIIRAELYKELQEEYPAMPGFVESDGRVKVPLAWVLDNVCGLKGWKNANGRVGLYEKQPLALVNFGGATAAEVADAAEMVALAVKEKTGIEIEWEVQKLGA